MTTNNSSTFFGTLENNLPKKEVRRKTDITWAKTLSNQNWNKMVKLCIGNFFTVSSSTTSFTVTFRMALITVCCKCSLLFNTAYLEVDMFLSVGRPPLGQYRVLSWTHEVFLSTILVTTSEASTNILDVFFNTTFRLPIYLQLTLSLPSLAERWLCFTLLRSFVKLV